MRASVIGRSFAVVVLLAASNRSERHVRLALDRACSLGLLVADGTELDHFSFRHALTRDIVYAELLARNVRPIHRRIARALEQAGPDASALGALAYHSWAAGDAARSLKYNELAGDRAVVVHALDDARTYYARARSGVDDDSCDGQRLDVKVRAIADR